MSFSLDEIFCYTGQLIVAAKKKVPKALGVGKAKVEHTAYIEGNTQIGKVDAFSNPTATLMVGREDAIGTNLAINTKGNQKIEGDGGTTYSLEVTGGKVHFTDDLICDAIGPTSLAARFGVADKKPVKPFDIQHPTKGEGWRLRYVSLEGPESGVYCRGRVKNQKIIKLPEYWKDLVHEDSITVQLQPIGSNQNLVIQEFNNEFIVIAEDSTNTDLITDLSTIDCFYHVYGERKDINPLIVEYEGNSWEDYPDPNYNPNKVDSDKKNTKDPRFDGPPNTVTK